MNRAVGSADGGEAVRAYMLCQASRRRCGLPAAALVRCHDPQSDGVGTESSTLSLVDLHQAESSMQAPWLLKRHGRAPAAARDVAPVAYAAIAHAPAPTATAAVAAPAPAATAPAAAAAANVVDVASAAHAAAANVAAAFATAAAHALPLTLLRAEAPPKSGSFSGSSSIPPSLLLSR